MILIFSEKKSNRLNYICNLLLKEVLGVKNRITDSKEEFSKYKGPKINYSSKTISKSLQIFPHTLLFEEGIKKQNVEPKVWKNTTVFFETNSKCDFPFDIFTASFFFVSRYEEYKPYNPEGLVKRFEANESIAYKHGIIEKPIVNIWANILKKELLNKFPDIEFEPRTYKFHATFDIDNAYAYLHKSTFRTTGALLRCIFNRNLNELFCRIRTLMGFNPDPYDTYDFINKIEKQYNFKSVFFFLVGDYGKYDKNISIKNSAFKKLIRHTFKGHNIGIHPSMASHKSFKIFLKEVDRLNYIVKKTVTKSRQHFLMLEMPATYQNLILAGLKEDYSMGYSTAVGFRAGICVPFMFYDLDKEQETSLKIYPFEVMDLALMKYLRLKPKQAIEKIEEMINITREVKGTFIPLWHNESLSGFGVWKGWKKVYEEMVRLAV